MPKHNRPTAAASRPAKGRRASGASAAPPVIRCSAPLLVPKAAGRAVAWTFLRLPPDASAQLPSRGQESVAGTLNGCPFDATLEPDGAGGHWLKVERKLRMAAGAEPGAVVTLEIAPVAEEPEPKLPADLRAALAAAPAPVQAAWADITPRARRDWVHWITSAKQPETRTRRVANACDMLSKGKRRPCCFDRSGRYSKSLSCPEADETPHAAPDAARPAKSRKVVR